MIPRSLTGHVGPARVDGILVRDGITPYETFGRLLALQGLIAPIAEVSNMTVGDGGIVAERGTDGVLRVRIPAPRSPDQKHGLLLTIRTQSDHVVISPADEMERAIIAGRPVRPLRIDAPAIPPGHESARERTARILVHAASSIDRCVAALADAFAREEIPLGIVDDEPEQLLGFGADARLWALGILGRSGRVAGVTLPSPWSGRALVTDYRERMEEEDWSGACPRFVQVECEPEIFGSSSSRTMAIGCVHLRGMFQDDTIHPARNAMETMRATAMADDAMRRSGTGAASGGPYGG
jgi:hypothetical protein